MTRCETQMEPVNPCYKDQDRIGSDCDRGFGSLVETDSGSKLHDGDNLGADDYLDPLLRSLAV